MPVIVNMAAEKLTSLLKQQVNKVLVLERGTTHKKSFYFITYFIIYRFGIIDILSGGTKGHEAP